MMNTKTSTHAIPPEAELLLRSVRARIDAETAARIAALARKTIDWDYLLRVGQSHRVLPLLYRSLNQVCPDAVPPAILEGLRQYFYRNTEWNFFLTSVLLKVLKALEVEGISAIPFKGPVLAAAIYSNLGLRQFNDLDILVHRRDIARTHNVLISQGFRGFRSGSSPNDPYFLNQDLEPDQIAPLDPDCYTFFMRDDGRVKIDPQWRLTRRLFSFSLDSKHLWSHLEPFSLGGRTVLTFPPDVLLLILCAHGCKHLWQRLKWVCDVAQLIEVIRNNNPELFFEQSLRNGNRRMVSLGLLLAHDLLGASLPEHIVTEIRSDATVKSAAIQVRQRLFAETDQILGDAERFIFYLKMQESWLERLQCCLQYPAQYLRLSLHSIFSPTSIERSLLPLPKGLTFLYYAFRPLRLLLKYASQPFKRDG